MISLLFYSQISIAQKVQFKSEGGDTLAFVEVESVEGKTSVGYSDSTGVCYFSDVDQNVVLIARRDDLVAQSFKLPSRAPDTTVTLKEKYTVQLPPVELGTLYKAKYRTQNLKQKRPKYVKGPSQNYSVVSEYRHNKKNAQILSSASFPFSHVVDYEGDVFQVIGVVLDADFRPIRVSDRAYRIPEGDAVTVKVRFPGGVQLEPDEICHIGFRMIGGSVLQQTTKYGVTYLKGTRTAASFYVDNPYVYVCDGERASCSLNHTLQFLKQ